MSQIKIAHEAPLSIFDQVEGKTDYNYALVHLMEENEEYFKKFKDSIDRGVHVILDNSVFELEEAFDSNQFLYWINKLQPHEYIIPDVLEDSYSTLSRLGEWLTLYQPQVNYSAKTIGVVQARSYDDFEWCYSHLEPCVDKVAISFDYSWLIPENTPADKKLVAFMRGRQELIRSLNKSDIINRDKPHHLLGTFRADEFQAYRDIEWIDSIDTSNPVVAGISLLEYHQLNTGGYGIETKPKEKLFTMINDEFTDEQISCVLRNIDLFRQNIKGV